MDRTMFFEHHKFCEEALHLLRAIHRESHMHQDQFIQFAHDLKDSVTAIAAGVESLKAAQVNSGDTTPEEDAALQEVATALDGLKGKFSAVAPVQSPADPAPTDSTSVDPTPNFGA